MRNGGVVLNFARDGIVDEAAVLEALGSGKLHSYVCDFPDGAAEGSSEGRVRCRTSAPRPARPRRTAR